jgi:hypothetical protein
MTENINDLIERTTINFPEEIEGTKLDDFFSYLHNEMSCTIRYKQGMFKSFERNAEPGSPKPEIGTVEVIGTITAKTDKFAVGNFETISGKTPSFIAGLRFQTIPGYSVEEHSPEEVKLWDIVREYTQKYFAPAQPAVDKRQLALF